MAINTDDTVKAALLGDQRSSAPTTVKTNALYAVFTPSKWTSSTQYHYLLEDGDYVRRSYTQWSKTSSATVKFYNASGTQVSSVTLSSDTSTQNYAVGYRPENYVIDKAVMKTRAVKVLKVGD